MIVRRRRVVRGLGIEYLHRRAGPAAVLLIHGNSSSKEVFCRQIPALARTGLSIVAADLPGHGGSDDAINPARNYSFPGYAAVLRELMSQLGYATYHVVGWSLGGHVGIQMWATSGAVRSLLLSGTPPIRLSYAGVSAGFHWTATTALAGRRNFDRQQAVRYATAMMGVAPGAVHRFLPMVERTDGGARRWMVQNGLNGVGLDQVDAISAVDRPLAILQGKSDPFVDLNYLMALPYRRIWRDRPQLLDGGHAVHWHASDEFNCSMVRFLLD